MWVHRLVKEGLRKKIFLQRGLNDESEPARENIPEIGKSRRKGPGGSCDRSSQGDGRGKITDRTL